MVPAIAQGNPDLPGFLPLCRENIRYRPVIHDRFAWSAILRIDYGMVHSPDYSIYIGYHEPPSTILIFYILKTRSPSIDEQA